MPTGYTADIDEGKATFKDFALRCARAFGHLLFMRDMPWDAPIPDDVPENFKPDTYYQEKLAEEEKRLDTWLHLSDKERVKTFKKHVKDQTAYLTIHIKERKEAIARYKEIQAEVLAWKEPSKDHTELKKFMLEQLDRGMPYSPEDMEADLAKLATFTQEQWAKEEMKDIEWNMSYYKKSIKEAKPSTDQKDTKTWIKELKESLK